MTTKNAKSSPFNASTYIKFYGGLYFWPTCDQCPEQYDVFTPEGEQVGYVRLRHGELTAEHPDYGGEEVYTTEDDVGDGCFDTEELRTKHLTAIGQVLVRHMDRKAKTKE